MEEFNKDFEKRLQDKLQNFEYAYDEQSWEAMQEKLQQASKQKPTKTFAWLRMSAIFTGSILLLLTGWELRNNSLKQQYAHEDRTHNEAIVPQEAPINFDEKKKDLRTSIHLDSTEETKPNANSTNRTMALNSNTIHNSPNHNSPKANDYSMAYAVNASMAYTQELAMEREGTTVNLLNYPVLEVENFVNNNDLYLKPYTSRKPLQHSRKSIYLPIVLQLGTNIDRSNYIYGDTEKKSTELSPLVGIYTELKLNDKLNLRTGVNLMGNSGKDISYQSVKVLYGLTRDSSVQIAKLDKIYYASVPIHLKYRLTEKMDVFAGADVSFLIGSKVIKQQANFIGDRLNTTISKTIETSTPPGIKRINISTPIGIEYHITPKIGINAAYSLGYLDISENRFFNQDKKHITNSAQLSIMYHL